MENSKNRAKKRSLFLLEMLVVVLLTAAIEYFYFGFSNLGHGEYISAAGDALTTVTGIKNSWTGCYSLLGWPFKTVSDYGAKYGMMRTAFTSVCGLFTDDPLAAYGAICFVVPLFNVIVCYLVLRRLSVRRWLAYLASLTFGFCPYVQYRLLGHGALASVECVPLVFLLCVWCAEDPKFNLPGKSWFKYKRNWAALFFAWMIADNGMVYYPYFSCFVFCVMALCLLLRDRSWKSLRAPLLLVLQVSGWMALMFLPTVVGMFAGAGNAATDGANRGPAGAMIYGLRINSLLLSPNGFGLGPVKSLVADYNRVSAAVGHENFNENAYAYMGIVGIAGFFLLLAVLASGRREKGEDRLGRRLWHLSVIQIAILVLSVQTGLGSIIGAFLRELRGYNRISPFLVFGAVLAVTLCAQALLDRYLPKGAKPGKKGIAVTAFALLLFIYGLWEQQGCYNYISAGVEYSADPDIEFVSAIEADAGRDAMVFQLPYMKSFENGNTGNIPDYDHRRGIVHSDTLRWSYGATEGSENDVWYRETSMLEPEDMIEELKDRGFAGIWLNLDGYEPLEGGELEAELCAAAGCEQPIRCGDGHTIYIGIK